jgi:hypothetical protein
MTIKTTRVYVFISGTYFELTQIRQGNSVFRLHIVEFVAPDDDPLFVRNMLH